MDIWRHGGLGWCIFRLQSVNGDWAIPWAPSFLDYKLGVTQTYLLVTRVAEGTRREGRLNYVHFLTLQDIQL